MNATEFKYQLLVTVETILLHGQDFDAHVDEVRERIKAQLAGHRTEKRLADYCEVSYSRLISEHSRML